METPSPGVKQRSPWLYVLLGCGGLAGLICLGSAVAVFFFGKVASDLRQGVTDPEERQKNAIAQLGAIPDGYSVVASVKLFSLMQTTILTDEEVMADGGVQLRDGHVFSYFRIMANDRSKKVRDFLSGKDTSPEALAGSGINIDLSDVVKKGQLNIEGRKYSYIASRGPINVGEQGGQAEGLNNAILFECPGDALHVGIWSQIDPSPEKEADEIDLTGTVADEEGMARFLKAMNPCHN